MRNWWPFLTRCFWRGHRIAPVTYHFAGFADPSPITFDECEVCGYIERRASPRPASGETEPAEQTPCPCCGGSGKARPRDTRPDVDFGSAR